MNKYEMIDRLTKRIGFVIVTLAFIFRDGLYHKIFGMVRDNKEETS